MSPYYLYGVHSAAHSSTYEPSGTLLATFSTEALAKEYVLSSTLRKPSIRCRDEGVYYYFKKGSLLRDYFTYKIVDVPHDPALLMASGRQQNEIT